MIVLLSIIFSLNIFTYQNEEVKFDDTQDNIYIYFKGLHCHKCAVNLSKLLKYENVKIIYYLKELESFSAKASIYSGLNKMYVKKEILFTDTDSKKMNKKNPFVEIVYNGKSKVFHYEYIFADDLQNSIKKDFIKSLKEDYGFKLNEDYK